MPDTAASVLLAASAPPVPRGDAPRGRVLFRLGRLAVTPRRLGWALLLAAFVVGLSLVWSRLDADGLHARAKDLPSAGVIIAITLLPLVGFPVSLLHLIAGVRFDFLGGILVVALTNVLHQTLGWTLVRVLPRRFFARLAPWRKKLAGAGHRDATLLCCLLPGVPYTVQLYLLPMIGTPFTMMLGLAATLHTARAIVTILLGDISDSLTPARIAALTAYYVALFAISIVALRNLRRDLAMNTTDPDRPDPAHVSSRARHLWQLAGSPAGRDREFKLQAEAELKKERAQLAEQAPEHPAEAPTPPARAGKPARRR